MRICQNPHKNLRDFIRTGELPILGLLPAEIKQSGKDAQNAGEEKYFNLRRTQKV